MCYKTVGRYREKSSTVFFTRSAYCLCRKQCPVICQPPAPQTSFSTSPRVTSLGQMSINPSQTTKRAYVSFPFFVASPQTRGLPATVFLRSPSATRRVMRLRLLPRMWERFKSLHDGDLHREAFHADIYHREVLLRYRSSLGRS